MRISMLKIGVRLHIVFLHFFSDINSLTEGTYKLKNGKWVKQQ